MKTETKVFFFSVPRDATIVILSLLLVVSVAGAANFAEPASTPPTGNTNVPLNVGLTDQTKAGDFWAASVGTNDGYCLGASCISAWPAGVTPSLCHIETTKVENQDPASTYTVGSGCTLSAADVAAGWIVGSWDHCSGVSDRDCAGPKYCSYTRVVCSGAVTIGPGTVTRQ